MRLKWRKTTVWRRSYGSTRLRWELLGGDSVKTVCTLEGTLLAGGEKRANGTKLIFAITTSSNHFARTLLPNHKFLGPEQLKYMDDKRSLCFKIYAEIEIPDTIKTHVDKIFYWNQRLVPMINNKLVEARSNFNSYIKKQYLGLYSWFNCITPILE